MQQTITLTEALALIYSGEIISLKVVAFDKKRKKGGNVFFYSECKKVFEKEAQARHYSNFTFDMRLYLNAQPTDVITMIHADLITEINGKSLIL